MQDSDQPHPRWTVSTMQRIGATPDLAAAAFAYASLGIPVFPCVPGGKRPLTPNGFLDATASTSSVRRWWQRTADANIGLPTGARSGVLVVDVDVHPAGSGFAAFERARSAGLAEGWAGLVRTPSGGLHAYYPATGQEQRSWQVPSAHVDFRGDGGYVIAPPSRVAVDGVMRTYAVMAVTTHEPRPVDSTALRGFLEPARPGPAAPSASLTPGGCNPEALARTVALTAQGGRNRALFWASCRMVEDHQTRASVLSLLMPAAQRAGLPNREIESTIDSAFRIASRLGPGAGPGTTGRSEAIRL